MNPKKKELNHAYFMAGLAELSQRKHVATAVSRGIAEFSATVSYAENGTDIKIEIETDQVNNCMTLSRKNVDILVDAITAFLNN